MVKANTRQKALCLLLISALGLLQLASAYTFNGHELRDLQACDRHHFEKEAQGWTASRLVNKDVITSECDGEFLLGGCNVLGDQSSTDGEYFERTYKHVDLFKHNMIYFSASFSLIDTWDAHEERVNIYINGEKLGHLYFSQKDFPSDKCGGPGKDLTGVYVVGKIPHDHKHLTIRIMSDSKSHHDKISFGFREISVLFVNLPDVEAGCEPELCALASVPLSKNECICPKGTFLTDIKSSLTGKSGKKCIPGNPNCVHSFGPTAKDCYECQKGTFFDGSCCTECHPECAECTGPSREECTKEKFKLCHKGLFYWGENEADEKCMKECPEGWKCDKDKHGNDICVAECDCKKPENTWFAEVGQCVCECPQGWKTQVVNQVPRCVKVCDKDEKWWAEGCDGGACVDKCPEGWEAVCDPKTTLDYCKQKCCDEDKDTWFEEKGECVCECCDGWEREKMNDVHVCSQACKKGQFWWKQGGAHGACVDKCADGWKCDKGCVGVDICSPQCNPKDDENIWFQEKGECVCECPAGWESDKINDVPQCVKSCDKGEFWWADACVCECPDGWKCDKGCEGVDICSPQCDDKKDEKIWFQDKKECVCECPDGWEVEKVNDVPQCVKSCDKGEFWWNAGVDDCGACVCECPEGWKCDKGCEGVDICSPQCNAKADENIWFQEKKDCVCECPLGWRAEKMNEALVCVESCDKDEFFWEKGGKDGACVCECPEGWKCDKGCEGVDICSPRCDAKDDENIWFQEKKECVCECPDGWRSEKVNDVLVCVQVCDKDQFWWEEHGKKEGACVCQCPEGWRADKGCEGVDICSPKCDRKDEENIWFQEKKECVCECCAGWEKEKVNDVYQCVRSCDKDQFFWEEGGKHGACVDKCPEGWKCDKGCEGINTCTPQCNPKKDEKIWFEERGECVCECPDGWEVENTNGVLTCEESCKKGQFWWREDDRDGACVDKCPEGWKCDKGCEGVDICSPQCNRKDDENIWFQEKGECVCECPDGWRKEKVNDVRICVKNCDKGQFWWEERGKEGSCVCECPVGWKCDKGCEGVDICTPQCDAKHDDGENIWFNEKKECVCECPTGWRSEKMNDVLVCVEVCEKNEFFWEEGGKHGACVDKCPKGWKCDKGCEGVDICTPQCDAKDDENIWYQEKGECVCECPTGWEKEKVNDVWVCSHACDCDQIFWEDCGKGSSCVEKCPDGWEKTKGCGWVDLCTPKCDPKDDENIWFQEQGECVCECCDGWEKEIVNGVPACVKTCDDCQFWWGQKDDKYGACVEKCPEGWKCDKGCEGVDICSPQCDAKDDENIWFQEKGECVCECPAGWEREKVNDVPQCVKACEKGQFFWQEGGEHGACVEKCPDGWRCDEGCGGVDICSPQCNAKADESIWFQDKKDCVCECPDGWRKEKVNEVDQCVPACDKGEFWWEEGGKNGACVCNCPEGWRGDKGCEGVDICVPKCKEDKDESIWFQEKGDCVCECPAGWRTEKLNEVYVCIQICDEGEFFWEKGGKHGACVCECPDGWKSGKGEADVDICKPQCHLKDDENIWFREQKECVCECPAGWEKEKVNAVPVCRKACYHGQIFWEEGCKDGVCVDECPEGWECAQDKNGLEICKPKCNERSKEKIWFQKEEQCVHKCPEDFEVEVVNKVPTCVPCRG